MNSDDTRKTILNAWRSHQNGESGTPLDQQIIEVILRHPEYQSLFTALLSPKQKPGGIDFAPEDNPFLHIGLHLGVADQIRLDRPKGITKIWHELNLHNPHQDSHDLEHKMLEVLVVFVKKANQTGQFDSMGYLKALEDFL